MKKLRKLCMAALCGVMLIASACGNTSASTESLNSTNEVSAENTVTIVVGKTKEVTSERSFQRIEKKTQTNITDNDLNITDSFDAMLSGIVVNSADNRDKKLDYVYSEIQKISDLDDYAITSVEKGDNGVIVSFESGIVYYYPVGDVGTKDGKGTLHISTQQPYNTSGDNSLPNEKTDQAALSLETTVENTVFDLNIDDDEVSYEMLDDIFAPNSIVLWDGHGGYEKRFGYFLPLGEGSWEAVKNDNFLKSAVAAHHIVEFSGRRMAITADFLMDMEINVTNSVFFLDTCYSMVNGDFASALVQQGASLVYGYTDSVLTNYADPMVYCILEEMSKKEGSEYTHFEAASKIARGKYGEYNSFVDKEGVTHTAYPCICGDGEYHFDAAIDNIVVVDGGHKISENALDIGKWYLNAFENSTTSQMPDNAEFVRGDDEFQSIRADGTTITYYNKEYYAVNGIECFSYEGLDNGAVTYYEFCPDVVLYGIYPGMMRGSVESTLATNGFTKFYGDEGREESVSYRYLMNPDAGSFKKVEDVVPGRGPLERYKLDRSRQSYLEVCVLYENDTVKTVETSMVFPGAG